MYNANAYFLNTEVEICHKDINLIEKKDDDCRREEEKEKIVGKHQISA